MWYSGDLGQYQVCTGGPLPTGSEDPNCSDSVRLPSIGDHNLYLGVAVSSCSGESHW